MESSCCCAHAGQICRRRGHRVQVLYNNIMLARVLDYTKTRVLQKESVKEEFLL